MGLKDKISAIWEHEVLPRVDRFAEWVWAPVDNERLIIRIVRRILQAMSILITGFFEKRITVHASALTYTTLLSVIPVIAVALSITQMVGIWSTQTIEEQIKSVLGEYVPMLDKFFDLVRDTDFSSVGLIGTGIVLLAAISMMSRIELAFNEIWEVRHQRKPWRKAISYLSIVIIITLTLLVAWTILIFSNDFIAGQIPWLNESMPREIARKLGMWALTGLGFALVLNLLPNAKVPWRAALIAGFTGSLVYLLISAAYFGLQIGVAKYNLIYSSLAAIPITIIWINLSWLIMLISARLTFVITHLRTYRRQTLGQSLSPAFFEESALRLVLAVACQTRRKADLQNPDAGWLSHKLRLPLHVIFRITNILTDQGVLQGDRQHGFYVGDKKRETLTLADILTAARQRYAPQNGKQRTAVDAFVTDYIGQTRELIGQDPANITLAEAVKQISETREMPAV